MQNQQCYTINGSGRLPELDIGKANFRIRLTAARAGDMI